MSIRMSTFMALFLGAASILLWWLSELSWFGYAAVFVLRWADNAARTTERLQVRNAVKELLR